MGRLGSRLVRITRALILSLLSIVSLTGCTGSGDGLTKYSVKGAVKVNGEPAAGIVVRFRSKDASSPGANARFPVGVTDDDGVFRVSTNGEADGAVAGEYEVTIVWPESDEPPLRDRLGGAYATAEKSKLQVTIEPGDNELQPFVLERGKGPLVTSPASKLDSDN